MTAVEAYDTFDGLTFLRELFRFADGHVVVTPIGTGSAGPRRSLFRTVDEIDDLYEAAMRQHNGVDNLYVRLTSVTEPPKEGRGRNDITKHGGALPIDLDTKDGWTVAYTIELYAALADMGLPITAGIVSGYGWHAYLFLDEALEAVELKQMLDRMKATMLRLGREIGARHGLDELAIDTSVYDLSRVMRLPGSQNVKHSPHLRCYITEADYSRRYSWDQLDEALDPLPKIEIARKVYAAGAPDDPNLGAPGREFNNDADLVQFVLDAFPGFYVTGVDEEENVYVARADRRTHGIVVYSDGHIAIYSATTRHSEMRVPAGSEDDKDGPWYPFNILAFAQYGGDFAACSKALAAGAWKGVKYGAAARSTDRFESFAERQREKASQQPPAPRLQLVPEVDAVTPATPLALPVPVESVADIPDGWIDSVDLLEAIGFTRHATAGKAVQFVLLAADRGASIAATVMSDGKIVIGEAATGLLPGLAVNTAHLWTGVLDAYCGGDSIPTWLRITAPGDLPDDVDIITARLRAVVQGVEGVGGKEPDPWVWATADEIVKRPKPPATLLARTDNPEAALIYANRISIIFGRSETTKTWLAAWAALDCIRRLGKRVAWFDLEEPGNSQGAYRLAQLGATDEEMRMLINLDSFMPQLITVDFGQRSVNTKLRDKLIAKLADGDVGLIIIDSFSELAGSQDLDDNQKPDVTFLRNHLINHLAAVAGVAIIDHTGHATGAREAGSINKKNAVTGTRIYVDQTVKFTPGQSGEARLWILKDRHSKVYPHCTRVDVKFDGEKIATSRHLAGIFRLTPVAGADRTASGDEIIAVQLTSGNGYQPPPEPAAAAPGGNPGRQTSDVQMLAELERGPFTSIRNACARMEDRFGTGRNRVETLLEILVRDGHIELSGEQNRKTYRGVPSTYSKDTKAAIAELKRVEFIARRKAADAGETGSD